MKTLIGIILTLAVFPFVAVFFAVSLVLIVAECAIKDAVNWVKEMPYK